MSAAMKKGSEKVDLKDMQVMADRERLESKYANLVKVISSEHETTIDFLQVDAQSTAAGSPTGHLMARVTISHSNILPLIAALEGQAQQLGLTRADKN